MNAPMLQLVELGFLEKADLFLLKSRFFPSKFGGKPSWLSLKPLPTPEQLSCLVCAKQTTFLLQVYSPYNERTDAFHRTIYVFVCKNEACCKANQAENLRVFRSQLAKENDFYSKDPPAECRIENEIDASVFNKLCNVCGCLGPKTCSKCHKVSYCSKEHQLIDWKIQHKQICTQSLAVPVPEPDFECLFREMELITEMENYVQHKELSEKSEEDKMKEYSEFLKSHKGEQILKDVSETELANMASDESENDRQLKKFKQRINQDPEQVLRYQRGGEPLWIAHSPVPSSIPNCSCGAKRIFEFQILPQLLTHMNVDKVGTSLDWGTLCVYTCSVSCSTGNQYLSEYIFKQDIV